MAVKSFEQNFAPRFFKMPYVERRREGLTLWMRGGWACGADRPSLDLLTPHCRMVAVPDSADCLVKA